MEAGRQMLSEEYQSLGTLTYRQLLSRCRARTYMCYSATQEEEEQSLLSYKAAIFQWLTVHSQKKIKSKYRSSASP